MRQREAATTPGGQHRSRRSPAGRQGWFGASEGIVSKKLMSRYKSGSCKELLKVKNPEYERRQ
jgi:hypothetical protein